VRRSTKPPPLLLAILLALVALLAGPAPARAQGLAPALQIKSLAFVPPRTLRAELRYLRYDLNAPLLCQFTLELDGREIRESNYDHRGADPRDFTVLFDLPSAPDGRAHPLSISVRDRPAPAEAYRTEPASITLGASTPSAPPLGAGSQPLLPLSSLRKEPSWIDGLTWKSWLLIAVGAAFALRWIWGLLTRAPAPLPASAPPVPAPEAKPDAPATTAKAEPRRKARKAAPRAGAPREDAAIEAPVPAAPPPPPRPVRLFYSYAHADEAFRDELEKHLSTMRRSGLIEEWHDRRIGAGQEWEKQIDENLEAADLVLLLISPDFLSSDYCYEVEMKRALERHARHEALVVSVILRPADWKGAPFQKLKNVPTNGRPISRWEDRDEAWLDVVQYLRDLIEDRRQVLGVAPRP
jgi:hypothetical protein